jgi:hypothetical protein
MRPGLGDTGAAVNWTIVFAAFGATTGAASLLWQLLNYRLTGGRIHIFAMHWKDGDHQQVVTNVVNVGRLDVSIIGYSVWCELPGYRLQKLRWRLRLACRAGLARSRRTLIFSSPSVHFHAPVEFSDDVSSMVLPAILGAGNMQSLPMVNLEWPKRELSSVRVAVHLGSGQIVQGRSIPSDYFRPIELKGHGDFRGPGRTHSLGNVTHRGGQARTSAKRRIRR